MGAEHMRRSDRDGGALSSRTKGVVGMLAEQVCPQDAFGCSSSAWLLDLLDVQASPDDLVSRIRVAPANHQKESQCTSEPR